MTASTNGIVESVTSAIRPYLEPRVVEGSEVQFDTCIDDKEVCVTVYADAEAFQINIDSTAVLCKLEDQSVGPELANEIVSSFIELVKSGSILVDRHSLFGHSVHVLHSEDPNFRKIPQYQSVGDLVLSKITRSQSEGKLTLP